MDKVVVLKEGVVLNEIELVKKQLVIGRDAKNDIRLDDASVSRRHAMLTSAIGEYFVEDLGSTNGSLLNDSAITKHILKSGDLLQLGNFVLRFERSGVVGSDVTYDFDKTQVIRPPKAKPARAPRKVAPKTAILRFFRGPKKGQSEKIQRSFYTLGKPGGEVAVIARRPQGFYLLRIGQHSSPIINSKRMDSAAGVKLNEGDMVEVGDNLVEISFSG